MTYWHRISIGIGIFFMISMVFWLFYRNARRQLAESRAAANPEPSPPQVIIIGTRKDMKSLNNPRQGKDPLAGAIHLRLDNGQVTRVSLRSSESGPGRVPVPALAPPPPVYNNSPPPPYPG